ncbi:MAG: tRNA uridine-5-carboxymethylaminomethyl(34) synthesis enzyme MnmG [Phycisphaera sp.]|nr:tRNA uridine-5-carboxymethylaminomethyl(34) synthesis enzyme MnmG [Phycisphaera sp.]
MAGQHYPIVVIGGGHAGVEAAWAAANMLRDSGERVALVTMDASKIGVMSCNPAIGGLAKGQMVREIDALGGLMPRAADATGIQFRILNASKGPAVQGPRCQSDKHRYAREVQRLLKTRPNLDIIEGTVERILTEHGRVVGLNITHHPSSIVNLFASSIVLTTGTFMRGLMHTGPRKTEGGRVGEQAAVGISGALREMGLELGRLKTGTPPRLAAETIDFNALQLQPGDAQPTPFSELPSERFPVIEQRPCHITHTTATIHDTIRANLDRAPMYNGQIETTGPRYCPSIEDKVVRFADRASHHVFLEPESLDTNEIYCNGISTSLPADVQDFIVHHLPGCQNARVLRYGYAVEYDMVWPHQIDATCMTKKVSGLFLAGQINGTSGYEEAAGQGLIAGVNAVRYVGKQPLVTLRRDQAYIGVMLDDLVTKTPREPYRMFTSRAEHRLLLRADNTWDRLTSLGREWGVVGDEQWQHYRGRCEALNALRAYILQHSVEGARLIDHAKRPGATPATLRAMLNGDPLPQRARDERILTTLLADLQYGGYIARQQRDIERLAEAERITLPLDADYTTVVGLRNEARQTLTKFRPSTLGQASRLAGITPADVMVLSVAMSRR